MPASKMMDKAEMHAIVSQEIEVLSDAAKKLSEYVDLLKRTLNADVSFPVIEASNDALSGLPAAKTSIRRIADALVIRARTRIKMLDG